MKSDLVDIEVYVVRDELIDAAILVQEHFDSKKIWLPRSQIEIAYLNQQKVAPLAVVTMPEWLAIEKGLV